MDNIFHLRTFSSVLRPSDNYASDGGDKNVHDCNYSFQHSLYSQIYSEFYHLSH